MTEAPSMREALELCPNPWCKRTVPPIRVSEVPDADAGTVAGIKIMCFYDCNLSGPVMPTEAEAITAWNTRQALSASPLDGAGEGRTTAKDWLVRFLNNDTRHFLVSNGPVVRSVPHFVLAAVDAALAATPSDSIAMPGRSEAIARVVDAWSKIGPASTNNTADFAELYFGEHPTQAMTMCPDDWNELSDALQALALFPQVQK